jgi:hypothetical protein
MKFETYSKTSSSNYQNRIQESLPVAPGFHAGRLGLRPTPGVEAGRYKQVRLFVAEFVQGRLFRISNLAAAASPWVLARLAGTLRSVRFLVSATAWYDVARLRTG